MTNGYTNSFWHKPKPKIQQKNDYGSKCKIEKWPAKLQHRPNEQLVKIGTMEG